MDWETAGDFRAWGGCPLQRLVNVRSWIFPDLSNLLTIVYRFLAWDVISELCFGEPFGFISKEQDVDGMAHALEATMLPGGVVLRLPWLLKTMKFIGLLKWIVPNTKDKTGVGRAMAVSNPFGNSGTCAS